MNPWWNLPFAVLALLALWCRSERRGAWWTRSLALLRYFGVDPESPRQAAADFFGIAGREWVLFVAGATRWRPCDALPGTGLLIDACSPRWASAFRRLLLSRSGGDDVEAPGGLARDDDDGGGRAAPPVRRRRRPRRPPYLTGIAPGRGATSKKWLAHPGRA